MTTATTTNKQLVLITPGTEVGTWGPYINTTTGILDKALGGTLTVAMAAANVTLAAADVEYQRILISGTLSANLNLTFPSGVGGAWIVTNSTANSGGPWTITATTGGGTTVALTQGSSTYIYSDGTNIGLANPSIIQANTVTNVMLVTSPFFTVKGVSQAAITVTSAAGNGTNATLNYTGPYTFTAGSFITVSGMNPSGYNGTYTVVSSTTASVTYANATTGFVSGGSVSGYQGVSDIPIGTVSAFNTAATTNILTTDVPWTASAYQTLTDGATITPDFSTGFNFQVTISGNRVLANPTSPKVGQSGIILVTQDATGTRTLSFGNAYKFAGGAAPTISSGANQKTALCYSVVSSSYIIVTTILAVA